MDSERVIVITLWFSMWGLTSILYPSAATSPSGYEFWLSWLPTLLFVVSLGGSGIIRRKLDWKRRWEAQLFLQRPHTLEASDAGITLEEPESTHRFRWSYFPAFRETFSLLILYVSPYGFWIIPKRAFLSIEDLEAFKALLVTRVKTGTMLPATVSGFPVRLFQPPPPPPAVQSPAEAQAPPGV